MRVGFSLGEEIIHLSQEARDGNHQGAKDRVGCIHEGIKSWSEKIAVSGFY